MENRRIKMTELAQNIGQFEGLPGNPRQWTREDLDKLKKSIEETPELLEARGLIVYPMDGQYLILGGNMRYAALEEMGAQEAPCIVLPEETTIAKMKEIVIKDNGSFGGNDWDALANEWGDLPLSDWGLPSWATPTEQADIDGLFEESGEQKEKGMKITIEVPTDLEDKEEDIRRALEITLEEWPGCRVR